MKGTKAMYTVRHAAGQLLADRVEIADGTWSRLRGLIGRSSLDAGEGLLLTPCQAVHMYGVRFAVDVVFLDEAGGVVATYEGLEPGTRTPVHRDAYQALELPAGTVHRTGTHAGDRIRLEERHRGAMT